MIPPCFLSSPQPSSLPSFLIPHPLPFPRNPYLFLYRHPHTPTFPSFPHSCTFNPSSSPSPHYCTHSPYTLSSHHSCTPTPSFTLFPFCYTHSPYSDPSPPSPTPSGRQQKKYTVRVFCGENIYAYPLLPVGQRGGNNE